MHQIINKKGGFPTIQNFNLCFASHKALCLNTSFIFLYHTADRKGKHKRISNNYIVVLYWKVLHRNPEVYVLKMENNTCLVEHTSFKIHYSWNPMLDTWLSISPQKVTTREGQNLLWHSCILSLFSCTCAVLWTTLPEQNDKYNT